jgi:hypothetical protein
VTTSRLPESTGRKIVLLALLASLVAGAVVNIRLWADVADEPDIVAQPHDR